MAIDDILSTFAELGASGKGGMFRRSAILGAIIGAGLGIWLTWGNGFGAVAGAMGTGAFLGWFAALLLRGFAMYLVFFFVILGISLGWKYLTGG